MSAEPQKLEAIRSEVCDVTLNAVAIISVPALALSLSRFFQHGWNPVLSVHVLAATIIITVALLRRRLPYNVRANTLLGLFLWLAWAGQVFSPLPTAFVYLVSATAMATVFYGESIGLLFIGVSIVVTLSSYAGFAVGFYMPEDPAASMSLTSWLSRLASVVEASIGPLIAVSRFGKALVADREQAEEATRAKSEFLGFMSHELRTPMAAIIGTAEVLEAEPMPQNQLSKVRRIVSSGRSLLSLLNDLLDLAKIEARQVRLENVAFNLKAAVEEARELFTPLASAKHIDLQVTYPPAAQDRFRGDPGRFRQIIQNLVGNAIKFTDQGAVRIAVTEEKLAHDRFLVRVAVVDTGTGLSKSDQERLFQPFVQGENANFSHRGGTGLGLSVSLQLAKLMGGLIRFESDLGKGSVFTLELPMEAESALSTETSEGAISIAVKPLRLLLAEDNEVIRDVIQTMLFRRGHVVDTVEDGSKSVAAVNAKKYDAVLMDMHMPVMDGIQATAAIRSLGSPAARVTIVALTASLTSEQRAAYFAAGINYIVPKPINWPTLFEIIEGDGITANTDRTEDDQTMSGGMPVLDDEAITELEQGVGKASAAGMLSAFRASLQGYETSTRTFLAEGNLESLKASMHSLKGLCLQFGATEVGELASKVDRPGTVFEEARTALSGLSSAVDRLSQALLARISIAQPKRDDDLK